jgi:hypothetical protein
VAQWQWRLARAARHVYAGRLIVEVQRLLIARLAAKGEPTNLCEATLQVCMRTLEVLESFERLLRERAEADNKERSNKTPAQILGRREPFPAHISGMNVHPALRNLKRSVGQLLH